MTTPVSIEDRFKFLRVAYFGRNSDPVLTCVDRAYRDVARTIRGFGRFEGRKALWAEARELVAIRLRLLGETQPASQDSFDGWHRESVEMLRALYQDHGFVTLYVGQAQKWLNMALKYAAVLGDDSLEGVNRWFAFAHVPIDAILLEQLRPEVAATFSGAWSKIDDYTEYLAFQKRVREAFPDTVPLAVEFERWGT